MSLLGKEKNESSALNFAAILLSIFLIVMILSTLKSIIVPLFIAIILSTLMEPVSRFMEAKLRFPRGLAALVLVLLTLVLLVGLGWLISAQITSFNAESSNLDKKWEGIVHDGLGFVNKQFNKNYSFNDLHIERTVIDMLKEYGSTALSSLTGVFSALFLVLLFMIFLMYYRKFFTEFLVKALHNNMVESKARDIISKVKFVLKDYFLGTLTVIAITGTMHSAGLLILGIDHAVFLGFLGALFILLPYFGYIIGALIPMLIAFITKDSAAYSLGVFGVFFVTHLIEANILTPYIVGSKVNINPMAVIIALLLFSALWGVVGMILALPITASLKVILDEFPATEPYGFVLGTPDERLVKLKIPKLKK